MNASETWRLMFLLSMGFQLFALGKEAGTLRVITTMAEHEDVVSCVRVDTTSLLLASASYDGGSVVTYR